MAMAGGPCCTVHAVAIGSQVREGLREGPLRDPMEGGGDMTWHDHDGYSGHGQD